MSSNEKKAQELKLQANEAIKAGQLSEALALYSQAIELDRANHTLYSNRSYAYLKLGEKEKALRDADMCIDLKPDWAKGYLRKGKALGAMGNWSHALDVFSKGAELDRDNPELRASVSEAKLQMEPPNPFAEPDVEQRLRENDKTRAYMDDPGFRQKLRELAKDTKYLAKHVGDARVMTALAALMGIDIDAKNMSSLDPFVSSYKEPFSSAKQTTPTEPEIEVVEEKDSSQNAKDKEKALAEKQLGNEAYKKKDFVTALAHYDAAIALDPSNVAFLTNKAAVYFEQEEWELCVEQCEKAVELGRETRTDYKVIAKALARIGNAYCRQEKWEEALKYLNKSIAEHRNTDIVAKKNEIEKKYKELQRLAYIDPKKSLEEKEQGNAFFKQGDFPAAIKSYTEAIKRNPKNAKLFSNRAACYMKLLEFGLSLKDCEECIRLDPSFVKGYVRKGFALLATKDTTRASSAFHKALEVDPNNAEAKDGLAKCYTGEDLDAKRKMAMHDPEVQAILGDPAMQMILQQMQSNPEALKEHLQNPEIALKIQKLLESGIIGIR